MEVTEADIARIPRTNLRVPVAEFAQVWVEAERRNRENARSSRSDPRNTAIVLTCRWLATVVVHPEDGARWYPARSPVSGETWKAYEELIQVEYVAAETQELQSAAAAPDRRGWAEGVAATLRWAWARTGPAPLAVGEAASM